MSKERPTTRYDTPLRVQKTGGSRAAFDALRALDRRRAWPIGIRKSDEWREIDDEPGRSAQAIAALASTKDWQKEWTVRRARERRLSFYLNWTLMQGLIDTPDGQAVVSWLWDNSDRAQVLDGTSIPMHKFNEDLPPKLESDKQVKDYVRFFCDHLWVEAGGFMVVDDADDLPFNQKERDDRAGCVLPLHMLSRDVTYNLTGTLAHAGHLFNVEFRLHPSGLVEMLKDTQIEMDEATVTVKWRRPFLVPVPELPSPPAKPLPPYEWPEPPLVQGNWNDLAVEAKRLFQDALNSAAAHARVRVQLAASHARVLNDDFGRNWGDRTLLRLGGFTYDQIDRVEPDARPDTGKPAARRREDDAAKLRLKWLEKQGRQWPPPTSLLFDAQPHTQLANVYRSVGRTDEARHITFDRLRIAGMHWRASAADCRRRWQADALLGAATVAAAVLSVWFPQSRDIAGLLGAVWLVWRTSPALLDWAFRYGFGYGLFPLRAILTFVTCVLVGGIGVQMANRGSIGPISFENFPQVMEVDVASVNDSLLRVPAIGHGKTGGIPKTAGSEAVQPLNAIVPASIPCGTQIEPFLYAADVFVPIIDLKKEAQCTPSGSAYAVYWQWARALYATLGWIVTSLTILTVSGVLRTRLEQ